MRDQIDRVWRQFKTVLGHRAQECLQPFLHVPNDVAAHDADVAMAKEPVMLLPFVEGSLGVGSRATGGKGMGAV
jgi:hypothetical protein